MRIGDTRDHREIFRLQYVRESEKAIGVSTKPLSTDIVWLPKSKAQVLWKGPSHCLVKMPIWLASEKFLLSFQEPSASSSES